MVNGTTMIRSFELGQAESGKAALAIIAYQENQLVDILIVMESTTLMV